MENNTELRQMIMVKTHNSQWTGRLFCVPLIFILMVVFGACSNRPSTPRGFPKEDAMAKILADLYVAEAVMNAQPYTYRDNTEGTTASYYKDVLDKHHLTKQEFDTILAWYTSHPYLYAKVYDKVISTLGIREAELKNSLYRADSLEREAQAKDELQGVKLWVGLDEITLPQIDTIQPKVDFSFPLDSVFGGTLSLEARYRFKKENQIHKALMVLIACYADSTGDTLRFDLERSFKAKISSLELKVPDNKRAIEVKGTLLDYDTLKKVSVHIDGIKLYYRMQQPHRALSVKQELREASLQ